MTCMGVENRIKGISEHLYAENNTKQTLYGSHMKNDTDDIENSVSRFFVCNYFFKQKCIEIKIKLLVSVMADSISSKNNLHKCTMQKMSTAI